LLPVDRLSVSNTNESGLSNAASAVIRPAFGVWVAAVMVMAWPWFRVHLDIFAAIDARLFQLILVVLPLGALSAWGYTKVRRRGVWRHEPLLLALTPVVLGAVYAPGATMVLLTMTLVAAAAGRVLLERLGLEAEFSVAAMTGLGLLTCVLFAAGITQMFRTPVFVLVVVLAGAVSWRGFIGIRHELSGYVTKWRRHEELKESTAGIAVFAIFVLTVMASLAWLTPVWSGDGLRAHLPLVRVYLLQHSLAVPDVLAYGYFPQGFEVLAAMGYALGGQMAAQGIEPVFFGLAILSLTSLTRCCGVGTNWRLTGAAVGMAVPFLHWSGTAFKNDMALATYQLGALLCFFRWRESRNFWWIVLGTFLTGMSFGVKHVALFGAIPIACLFGHAVWQQKRRVLAGALLGAVFLCFGMFWHARTYLAKGTLVFPASTEAAVQPAHAQLGWGGRIVRFVTLPYRVQVNGKRNFESGSKQPLGIILLMVAPLWLLRARQERNRRGEAILWFFVLVYCAYWGAVINVLRYAIAPVLLLAALGAARLETMPRWAVNAGLGAVFLFSLPVLAIMEMAPAQIPYLLKRADAAEFLRKTLPPYNTVEYLALHAKQDDAIASVGNWAAGYAANPAVFDHVYRNRREYTAAHVEGVMTGARDYLILPNHANLSELERAASEKYELARVFADREFVVYRLTARNGITGGGR
jgi:hypothetical protein